MRVTSSRLNRGRAGRLGLPARTLALGMACVAMCNLRVAHGDPADIFAIAAPTAASAPPKAADIQDRDASVSTQTGALQYSYPIHVPPGRNHTQPELALTYSSQGPTYGGIAAGWSLSIPTITEDTTNGRLWTTAFSVTIKKYESSMAGGRPLIPTDEPLASNVQSTYRAQNDATFTRYQIMNAAAAGFQWRALNPDGTVLYFGDTDHIGNCTSVSDSYAPLTRVIDPFGNAIHYTYQQVADSGCRIKRITWGENTVAGTPAFASIDFNYDPAMPSCAGIPIGSQVSYRTGTKIVTGASKLDSLVIKALGPNNSVDHQRVITLAYSASDADCAAQHAAFRSLLSIQESAWGPDAPRVDLPAIGFTYGPSVGAPTRYYPPRVFADTIPPWSGDKRFNLGWGRMFRNSNGRPSEKWPTVEAMMLDVDGDGLLDRVSNAPVMFASGAASCRAVWQRNLGPGAGFSGGRYIPMPTLKWATPLGSSDVYEGGSYAGQSADGQGESCSLNYQETGYKNSFPATACPGLTVCPSQGYCTNGSDCATPFGQSDHTNLAFRWIDIDGDGLVDLVASIAKGGNASYNVQQGLGRPFYPPGPVEPLLFGPFPPCPTTSVPGLDSPGPYTMCGHMYPWFVYKNHGNGVFGIASTSGPSPLPDRIIYQPVPLETDTGDSPLLSYPIGVLRGTVDIDGDGYPDAVIGSPIDDAAVNWKVFRNDGTGALQPAVGAVPYLFSSLYNGTITETALHSPVANTTDLISSIGLVDVNGDGLIDHWNGESSLVNLDINNGVQFLSQADQIARPGNDGEQIPSVVFSPSTAMDRRYDSRRLLDVDNDGRPDLVRIPPGGGDNITTLFNQGGRYSDITAGAVGYGPALGHTTIANKVDSTFTWEIRSDMVDLDGDGILEGVDFGDAFPASQLMVVSSVADAALVPNVTPLTKPPRLLVSIDNGRGAVTSVSYSSMANSSVVEQHPELGRTMPHTEWVVQSVTVTDAPASTTSTSTHHYKNPRFSPDDRGRYGFRGFDEVVTTHPGGSQTVNQYDYGVDWSGRLKTTLVMPGAGSVPGEIQSIDETIWAPYTLFSGHVTAFFATTVDHGVCKNGQLESACRANTDTHTRTLAAPTALSSTTVSGPALLYEVTASTSLGGSTSDARITQTTYAVDADADVYRVRSLAVTKSSQAGGPGSGNPLVMYAKTARTWDPTFRVALTDEVWVDAIDANRAITRRAYDMSTGNVTRRWKPEQNASNTTSTAYTYDLRQLFLASEVNELGLQVDYVFDYGTGAKLVTFGPNVAGCAQATPPTCSAGDPLKEERKIRVDGLGRVIERWESFSDDGSVYKLYKVEDISYDDNSWRASGIRTSVTHQHAFDVSNTGVFKWTKEKTDQDGHGRPSKKTVYTFGSVARDHVTTFQYSNDGTLSAVTVPNPNETVACSTASNDTGCTVTYTYTFDTLGRSTGMRRPDSATPSSRSGVDISYDGLSGTTTEIVGGSGGETAVTKVVVDAFGRVIEVDELRAANQWAVTKYSHTPDDEISAITDPESRVTTLVHDFAGRRTQITRGTSSWNYTYDRNGNLRAELVPGATSVVEQLSYTTTIAYDDLDRPSSKSIGQRKLSASDQALFATGTETFTWDYGNNRKGHLRYWSSYAPNSSTRAMLLDLGNNAQGQRTLTNETITLAGFTDLSRQFVQNYYLSGELRTTHYRDYVGAGATNETTSTMLLDARGLPTSMTVTGPASSSLTIAVQSRNVAGLVTKRHTDITGQPMTYIESNWSFDALGRITSQVVQKGPGTTQVVRQDLAYFGSDDPSQLDHWLGAANHKQFHYTYDARHQLTQVSETAGAFTATYGYGNAGRFAAATEAGPALPGGDVRPRNVTYEYSATRPEEVTGLINTDGSRYANYTYDLAGSQLTRDYVGGDHLDYTYDGKDQLRRTTRKSSTGTTLGSEEYWYDLAGERTIVVKRDAAGSVVEMIWFMDDTEAHYDAAGRVVHAYSHISMGTPVARVDRTSNTVTALEYQFHGLASNTLAAVDKSGTVNASFSYAPFGELIESTSASGSAGVAGHRRRLNDKYFDEVSDLAYYGARFYDKVSMGWTQGDPLYHFAPDYAKGDSRRANLYQFSLNNPLRYVDADGRDSRTQTTVPAATVAIEAAIESSEVPEEGACVNPQTTQLDDEVTVWQGELADAEHDDLIRMLRNDKPLVNMGLGPVKYLIPGPAIGVTIGEAIADHFEGKDDQVEPLGRPGGPPGLGKPGGPKRGSAGGPGEGKTFADSVRDKAETQAGSKCVFCGKKTTRKPGPSQRNTDHAIAKSKGGNSTLKNAQNACRTCNLKKGIMTTIEFLKSLGRSLRR